MFGNINESMWLVEECCDVTSERLGYFHAVKDKTDGQNLKVRQAYLKGPGFTDVFLDKI